MKMRVRDVMTTEVLTIGPEAGLKEAATLMARRRISGLPVVEGRELVGIITESDFVNRLADDNSLLSLIVNRDRGELGGVVREAMSTEVITVDPDASVSVAARLMADHGVKRLPVVDRSKNLIGIVSRADLMAVFARPDERIRADVINGGVVGLGVGAEEVGVDVVDGVVRLRGVVASVTAKRVLEEFARSVPGVVAVESELQAALDDTRLPPL